MFNDLDIANIFSVGASTTLVILLIVGLSAWAFTICIKLLKEMMFN